MVTRNKVRVLIADDSPHFRDLIAKVVSADPMLEVVATAHHGREAAQLCKGVKPDIITIDLNMPDADGFEGISEIMAETPTPILVLSANREESDGFRALSLGALDILAK